MRCKLIGLIIIFLLVPSLALAITSSHTTKHHVRKKAKKPQITKKIESTKPEEKNPFKFSGYIDGSYNNLQRNYFTSHIFDRQFDNEREGFTLHQASITLAYQPTCGWGGLINPIMGYDTNIFAPYGFRPITEFDSQTFSIDVPQAYIQYAYDKFTIAGGRFFELAGYESLDPTQDTNFSRSILYYFEPFTVLGLRGIYAPCDKLTLVAGINNGWDNIRDWSRVKTVELSTTLTPCSLFSFASTVYTGQERVTPQTDLGPTGWRTLIDLIATFNVSKKLTFVVNYDYAWQTRAKLPNNILHRATWQGIAGYLNYTINDCWLTSLRGEYFYDQNGFRTGIRQQWKEITLTLGYLPCKNFEIRGELRHDFSNVKCFTNSSGLSTSNNAQSYAVEAFYKFG